MSSIDRRTLMRTSILAPIAYAAVNAGQQSWAVFHPPLTVTAPFDPPDEACTPPSTVTAAPAAFLETGVADPLVGGDGRLIQPLRRAAQTRNPFEILKRAAIARFMATPPGVPEPARTRLITANSFTSATARPTINVAFANALADLAVTGRSAYSALRLAAPSMVRTLTDGRTGVAARLGVPAAACEWAVNDVLARASRVAIALRAHYPRNETTRRSIGGWIAVSGEDDPPHRPVNVAAPPYPQYEIPVSVGGVNIPTRFFVAARPVSVRPRLPVGPLVPPPLHPLPTGPIVDSGFSVPADAPPFVPDTHRVILFIHGHSSSAEEALAIIPHILDAGAARGVNYAVVSIDLPNNGYSGKFNHFAVPGLASAATTFPGGIFDTGPINTPVLDFIENFIVAFVDALDAVTPVKANFAGVIGGSLGGNMALRLGRRDATAFPWLARGLVAWSPASVWDPFVRDELKRHAPEHCREKWNEAETPIARGNYFREVFENRLYGADGGERAFDEFLQSVFAGGHSQPDQWYRDGWPCKAAYEEEARTSRRETYHEHFRRWHWRVAGEQLVFSHRAHERYEDGGSPIRYTSYRLPLLLAAGSADDFPFAGIYSATRDMAGRMSNTPGTTCFFNNTGHSIHVERPHYFAGQIVDFLLSTT